MTDQEYYRKLKEILPMARGMTPEEILQSQVEWMVAQQKAYTANKEFFDGLWGAALQNDPMEVKRQEILNRPLKRFRAWCEAAGPWPED